MTYAVGVAAGKLTPRIAAPVRLADFVEGRNSAIEAIAESLMALVLGN